MAAATKAADVDKDLQSLMELQEKLNMHAGMQQMVMQQMKRAQIVQRRSDLTLQELSQLSTDVPVYQQVGKAYLMAPLQQVKDELKEDVSSADKELKQLAQKQQHAAKALAATEVEIQELFKASPELTRQLMPVKS